MKKACLFIAMLLTLTVALQGQTSTDPTAFVEDMVQQFESNLVVANSQEIIQIDNVEARFVPKVVKESRVLRADALASYDWDRNPYRQQLIVIDFGGPMNRDLKPPRHNLFVPNLYTGNGSGGIPLRR